MTDLKLFREYEPHECGGDGYPLVWSRGLWPWGGDDDATGDYIEEYGTVINFSRTPPPDPAPGLDVGVKDIVRMLAGHRCIRCGHPYREGRFTWAPRRPEEPAPDVQLKALNDDLAPADRAGHRTHWSPCDEHCQHSAPIRVRDQPRVEFAVPANAPVTDSRLDDVWRYWPTLRKRDALQVDPVDNAGAIVRDWKDVEAAWRVLTDRKSVV